jgi:hypothetical protein
VQSQDLQLADVPLRTQEAVLLQVVLVVVLPLAEQL